jgi:hypothetical protein
MYLPALLYAVVLGAPVPEVPEPEPPRFELRAIARADGGMQLTFEVFNPNARPLPYRGYEMDPDARPVISPLYSVNCRRGEKWEPSGLVWCKTGSGPVELPARGKVTFTARVPPGDWDEVKVGLVWYPTRERDNAHTAWTTPIAVLKKQP